jgi:hypothetical protein
MIRTEREKTREVRKLNVLELFVDDKTLYTNQVAKKIGVVWPVADRLLNELVEERKLTGDKAVGYKLFQQEGVYGKIKKFLHL